MSTSWGFNDIIKAIKDGADLGTILLKLGAGIVEAITSNTGKSTDEVLSDIRAEITATEKAKADAEARERKIIEGS